MQVGQGRSAQRAAAVMQCCSACPRDFSRLHRASDGRPAWRGGQRHGRQGSKQQCGQQCAVQSWPRTTGSIGEQTIPPLPLTSQSWLCMVANTVPGCSGLNQPRGAGEASAAGGGGGKGKGAAEDGNCSVRVSAPSCIRACGVSAANEGSNIRRRRQRQPPTAAPAAGRAVPPPTSTRARSLTGTTQMPN